MRGSQSLGFKNVFLRKIQSISYGDGNGQVFFTFDWLDFRMEFETTIGQNSLIFVCFETGYHRTTEYTTKCWGSERDINGPWRGPRSETKGTLGPAGAQNLWYDSGYISI